jgi:hypothetical protein
MYVTSVRDWGSTGPEDFELGNDVRKNQAVSGRLKLNGREW